MPKRSASGARVGGEMEEIISGDPEIMRRVEAAAAEGAARQQPRVILTPGMAGIRVRVENQVGLRGPRLAPSLCIAVSQETPAGEEPLNGNNQGPSLAGPSSSRWVPAPALGCPPPEGQSEKEKKITAYSSPL